MRHGFDHMHAESELVGSLDDVEFVCSIDLSYHDDLRRVQRNLNECPHSGRNPCVPLVAVAQMFANPRSAPSRFRH